MPFLIRSVRSCVSLLTPATKRLNRHTFKIPLEVSCSRCRSLSTHSVRTEIVVEDDPNQEVTGDAFNEEAPDVISKQEPIEPMFWDRRVPRTIQEFKSLSRSPRTQVENPKLLRVSIVGSPNAGKSTLINQILGWRVCSTSSKVHTTRRNTLAIMTEENVQIVLIDTPGVVKNEHGEKHKLERSLITDAEKSLPSADVIGVIVDASKRYSEYSLDPLVLSLLYKNPFLDAVLILNKVDLVKKKMTLLEMSRNLSCNSFDFKPFPRFEPIEKHLSKAQKNQLFQERFFKKNQVTSQMTLEEKFWVEVEEFKRLQTPSERKVFLEKKKGWPKFKEIFMISALDGDGTGELKNYFTKTARNADWKFNPELVSNQSPREIVLLAVREKLLEHLRMKLPYQIELFLKEWEIDDKGTLRLAVRVKCPRRGAMKIVMGEGGNRIREVAYEAGQEMMNTFRCEVLLKLIVCV